jgi:xylulokinase
MEPDASGAFVGLTLGHRRAHLARAVLEGVACSLRATRDAVVDAGGRCDSWLATGNGLASPLWRRILADIFGEPLAYVDAPERSGVGSALLAGIGTGVYGSFTEASEAARPPLRISDPDPSRSAHYESVYQRYLRLSALLVEESREARREARAWRASAGNSGAG